MPPNIDDPRLTAYALGELDGPEYAADHAEMRSLIAADNEARQYVELLTREFFARLIDLVHHRKHLRKRLHRWEIGILHDDRSHELSPGMVVEIGAHHFTVLGPFIECVYGGVSADDPFSVIVNKGKERGLLLVVEREFAGRV